MHILPLLAILAVVNALALPQNEAPGAKPPVTYTHPLPGYLTLPTVRASTASPPDYTQRPGDKPPPPSSYTNTLPGHTYSLNSTDALPWSSVPTSIATTVVPLTNVSSTTSCSSTSVSVVTPPCCKPPVSVSSGVASRTPTTTPTPSSVSIARPPPPPVSGSCNGVVNTTVVRTVTSIRTVRGPHTYTHTSGIFVSTGDVPTRSIPSSSSKGWGPDTSSGSAVEVPTSLSIGVSTLPTSIRTTPLPISTFTATSASRNATATESPCTTSSGTSIAPTTYSLPGSDLPPSSTLTYVSLPGTSIVPTTYSLPGSDLPPLSTSYPPYPHTTTTTSLEPTSFPLPTPSTLTYVSLPYSSHSLPSSSAVPYSVPLPSESAYLSLPGGGYLALPSPEVGEEAVSIPSRTTSPPALPTFTGKASTAFLTVSVGAGTTGTVGI